MNWFRKLLRTSQLLSASKSIQGTENIFPPFENQHNNGSCLIQNNPFNYNKETCWVEKKMYKKKICGLITQRLYSFDFPPPFFFHKIESLWKLDPDGFEISTKAQIYGCDRFHFRKLSFRSLRKFRSVRFISQSKREGKK